MLSPAPPPTAAHTLRLLRADARGDNANGNGNPPATGNRPRVLLIAEGCNPDMISVPLVGYSHARAIKQLTDALVVTHWRNGPHLAKVGWVEGTDYECIDSEYLSKFVWKYCTWLRGGYGTGWTTLAAFSAPLYLHFEHELWKRFAPRLRAGEFDVVHRLIPLSPTTPSLMATECRRLGIPFVVGPLNGGVPWPRGFEQARRREHEWLSYVRWMYKLVPGYRAMRQDAAAILVASRDTFRQMPRQYHDKCFYLPENAIDPLRFPQGAPRPPFVSADGAKRPVRAIFVGRLVPYKGADMLVEAAAPLVRAGRLVLDVVGDGPQMPDLRALVARHGAEAGVRLTGWIDHRNLKDLLATADVFPFPSIREFGGGVVLEAMASGVVPIVVDYAGPGELVTERTGYRIPLGTREQIVGRLGEVLGQLCTDPSGIAPKAAMALRRAREQFTWEHKAQQVMEIYRWVLGRAERKPQFAMPVPDPCTVDGDASTILESDGQRRRHPMEAAQ